MGEKQVAKQETKKEFLQVPDCLTIEEFRDAAGKVWRKHHPESIKKQGRPSDALSVFEACEEIVPEIIQRKSWLQTKFHMKHLPEDSEKILESFDDCPACKKKFPLHSIYVIRKGIEKRIDPEGKALSNDEKNPKKRARERHIKAWLYLQYHPEWLDTGIPKRHCKNFQPGQIKAFDIQRQAYNAKIEIIKSSNLSEVQKRRRFRELAEDQALLSLDIQELCRALQARQKRRWPYLHTFPRVKIHHPFLTSE